MQKETRQKSGLSRQMRIFLKSAAWTFIAFILIALGFFGAGYFSGAM